MFQTNPNINNVGLKCQVNTKQNRELAKSAIAPEFLGGAVEFAPNLEFDPLTNEVIATPLDNALEKRYTRFGHRAKPDEWGFIFWNEDGSVWQVKRELGVIQKNGRSGKYLAPKGNGNAIYTPPIPRKILKRICKRHGLKLAEVKAGIAAAGGSFWEWVKTSNLPLIVTEGAKKALSLLSRGFIAIALYGCTCGRSEALKAFLSRDVIAAFDSDSTPNAKKAVARGLGILSHNVSIAGGNLAIAQWSPDMGKGIDDFIAWSPLDADEAIANAIPSSLYWARVRAKNPLGKYKPNLKVNVPCLTAIDPVSIPDEGIVVLFAGCGVGKTKLAAQLLKDEDAIAPGHRISLQRGSAISLDMDYIGDCDTARGYVLKDGKPTKRVVLCFDSILLLNQANFPPGTFDILLDEIDQGLSHLLKGATCGKNGMRPGRVQRALYFIKNAKRIIPASATLTQADIDLVAAIRGEQPWIIENTYRANGYPATLYTNTPGEVGSLSKARGAAISEFMNRIGRGEKGLIAADQKNTTKMLELMGLALGLTDKEILTINQDTSGEDYQKSFLDSPDKGQWLKENHIKLLIYSPSMTSGVSIEALYFDFVGGLFEGKTISPDDALQQLIRYRPNVPRVIFAAAKGMGDGMGFTPEEYRESMSKRSRLFTLATGRTYEGINESIADYLSSTGASRNRDMSDFSATLQAKLEAAGHTLTIGNANEVEGWKDAVELWKLWRREIKEAELVALWEAGIIHGERALELREKQRLNVDEANELNRFDICDFYRIHPEALEIEDIKTDGKGRMRKAIARLENLLWDGLARAKDTSQWDKLTLWKGDIMPHDLPRNEIFEKSAIALDVHLAIEKCFAATKSGEGWHDQTPWAQEFGDRMRSCSEEVKIALGFQCAKKTNCEIIGEVLRRLGIKTQCDRKRIEGKTVRVYTIEENALGWLKEVLDRRAQKHLEQGLERRATPLTTYLLEGVTQTQTNPQKQKIGAKIDPDQPPDPPPQVLMTTGE